MEGSRDTSVRPIADVDGAPILWLCPTLEAAAHCLSQALGLEEGGDATEARLRWCQVVVCRGAAGGRVACEVGDGPFLIRRKEC